MTSNDVQEWEEKVVWAMCLILMELGYFKCIWKEI